MTDLATVELDLEGHRHELIGYCYRMLGSAFDAEDAVQETMVRAWRNADRFEGRASLRSWLFRIATNVCLDMLGSKHRRVQPVDLGAPPWEAGAPLSDPVTEDMWVLPAPDDWVIPMSGDPADVVVARETVRLAFVAALQTLPPRQRAVLVLCEVLRWKAAEVAELLDSSVASVNSALQRARATLDAVDLGSGDAFEPTDPAQVELLNRYVDAFERYDMESLTALLHQDATQSMPPYEMWVQGRDDILAFWVGPGAGCRGSRLIPTAANGLPAFGQYKPSGPDGEHEPWALQVLDVSDGCLVGFTFFLDTQRLFPLFGLPPSPNT